MGVIYLLNGWALLLWLTPAMTGYLALEDGFLESFGASYLFLAGLVFAIAFILSRNGNTFYRWHTRRNYFFLLLALMLFFGGGEEISWGQRILHFKTPQEITQINKQHEFNIH